MRRISLIPIIAVLVIGFAWASRAPQRQPHPAVTVDSPRPAPGPLYDNDPNHIWNRLDRHLRVRVAADGKTFGADAVDPLLWRETRHLLTEPSHLQTLALLDEFLNGNAERLVMDPLRRALFQRDLWAIFDWTVASRDYDAHAGARHALATRLARIIRRVALTAEEVASLPDSYTALVVAGRHPTTYDPQNRERAFLPVGLLDPGGDYVAIHGDTPVAQHSDEMSRSAFGVFLNLPGGRGATLRHLRTLWNTSEPFVVDPIASFGGERRATINPAVTTLPEGAQIALARRMLLIDTDGQIRGTNVMESLQIRVFRKAEPCLGVACAGLSTDQDFYEFVLDRAGLLTGDTSGLRPIGRHEASFTTFSSKGIDPFEYRSGPVRLNPRLQMCVACHQEHGLASVRTSRRLFKPHSSADGGGPPGDGLTHLAPFWKTQRSDWGYLQALWHATPR